MGTARIIHRMPPARYPAYRSTRVNRGLSPMLSPTSLGWISCRTSWVTAYSTARATTRL